MLRRPTASLGFLLACGGSASQGPLGSGEPSPPMVARAQPDEVPAGAGTPPVPPTHCVDLSAAGRCVEGGWPGPPMPIVRASELGAGFAFASLNDNVAFANGLPHPKAV